MPNTSQMMAARMPTPPSNQLLSSSQYSEAISIVSPSEYLAARPHPRAGNTSRQSPTTFTDEYAHPYADESQFQSQFHPQSNTPTPTQPIYIIPRQSRRRCIDRQAPLGFELPKGHVGSMWQQPLPGQIHHRADEVKNYHLKGTSGWEGFEQRRLAIAQAEIGKIDTAWAANGGGVILDFGVKKRRGRKAVSLSTIIEEEEDGKKNGKDERGSGKKEASAVGAGEGKKTKNLKRRRI